MTYPDPPGHKTLTRGPGRGRRGGVRARGQRRGAVVRDGEYLLVERAADEAHAGGRLAFPGGKVEPPPDGDPSLEAAVRRELAEEVRIDVGTVEYVHSRTFRTDDGTSRVNVVTLCEHEGGEARVRAPDEIAAVHWLSPDAVRDHPNAPGFLERDVERIEAIRRVARE